MKMLAAAVTFATLVVSPAFAQPYKPHRLDHPGVGPHGGIEISAARAAALRKCSAIAARYPESTWGDMEIDQYRACMAEHGQVE
jgi:hypothetical protein